MPSDDTETSGGQIVRINGVDIFYKAYGQGQPLLLIHGGTLSGDSWQPYLAGFAEHFRVIVPDTPGHGRSGTPAGVLSYPGLADDMAAFSDALELRKPLIAGYSDGGQIALEIGMRHPALPRATDRGRRLLPLQPVLSRLAAGRLRRRSGGGRHGPLPAQPPRVGGMAAADLRPRRMAVDSRPRPGRCGRSRSTTPPAISPGSWRRRWSFSATATRSSRSRKRRAVPAASRGGTGRGGRRRPRQLLFREGPHLPACDAGLPPAIRRRGRVNAPTGQRKPGGHVLPVHQLLEEVGEVGRALVAEVDVVGMLPDVAAEERGLAEAERVHPVLGLRHLQRPAVLDQPRPARAELAGAGGGELLLELLHRAEGVLQRTSPARRGSPPASGSSICQNWLWFQCWLALLKMPFCATAPFW